MFQIPASLRLASAGLLFALLYWLLYQVGLPGGFIFDDAPNLNGLASIEAGGFSELVSFSLKGIAGPSGRPLSLFSFALQHDSWPRDPGAFKQVNMLIHLLNASLLLWLLTSIQRLTKASPAYRWIPLAAAALWLLWPIHVSSVLYVVQRMTLLSATCMLAGFLIYVKARSLHATGTAPVSSLLLVLASLFTGTVIGILCKENAIVFPLLVLVLEATLFSRLRTPLPRLWKALLWLPIAIFLVYLLVYYQPWTRFGRRDFDLYERVLTQGRILWMYVHQIVLPSASSLRFLYDNYPISTSPWAPVTTAIAWVGWIAIGLGAWFVRQRQPVFAFGVLFFLASHALESTVMPLELVFEHRNYLGSAALALALTTSLATWAQQRPALALGLGVLYFAIIAIVTFNLTSLWGQPPVQYRIWQEQNPTSARAQLNYAANLLILGHSKEATQAMDHAMVRFPHHPAFALARVEVGCFYPELRPASLEAAANAASTGTGDILGGFAYLDRLTNTFGEGHCTTYSAHELIALIRSARGNPVFRLQIADLHMMEGIICNTIGDTACARQRLHNALRIRPQAKTLIQAAAWEMSQGNPEAARHHLEQLEQMKRDTPRAYYSVKADIDSLLHQLATEPAPP